MEGKVNPQLENGYTMIANEIIEALIKQNLSGQEMRVILFIIRKTYGFKKKTDKISYSQIAQNLGISRVRAVQVIHGLLVRKILLASKENITSVNTIEFIKDYSKWLVRKNVLAPASKKKRIQLVRKSEPTKETLTKENIYIVRFSEIWDSLPSKMKIGKKKAQASFIATIKSDKLLTDFKKALNNYTSSKRVKDGYIQNGSTWFNNWQDWTDYKEIVKEKDNWRDAHRTKQAH